MGEMSEKEELVLTEYIKKFELNATTFYNFQKLILAGKHFLKTKCEENEETITFIYNIEHLISMNNINNEEYTVVLNLLMQAAKFQYDITEYQFSMNPDNLYYNSNGDIRIKSRDLIETKQNFVLLYKALIGCVLFDVYDYEDYLEGGEELFQKNDIIALFFEMQTTEEIVDYLEHLKNSYLQKKKDNKTCK